MVAQPGVPSTQEAKARTLPSPEVQGQPSDIARPHRKTNAKKGINSPN
jgi:hypothetical protein